MAESDNIPLKQLDISDLSPDQNPSPVLDFYDHKKYNKSTAKAIEEHIRDKYYEDEEVEEINEIRSNRKKLSERLEADPEFREQYITDMKKKQTETILRELYEQDADSTPGGAEEKCVPAAELPQSDDQNPDSESIHPHMDIMRQYIYINKVKNLHVHFH